jgi:hypothetical protein
MPPINPPKPWDEMTWLERTWASARHDAHGWPSFVYQMVEIALLLGFVCAIPWFFHAVFW